MPALKLSVETTRLAFAAPFRIAGRVFEHQDVVRATLDDGTHCGRGEAAGVFYLDDDAEHMVAAIEARRRDIEAGVDRAGLQRLLPIGGARNALDCALWELEARRSSWPASTRRDPSPRPSRSAPTPRRSWPRGRAATGRPRR
jgi:L-alanine-DL-glutamate epimerase-like enolase superfamily enzyme